MVDHEYGEIWHMVSAADDKPVLKYPKSHNSKTSLHSFEHALFSYMTAARVKGESFDLYYALPEWERVSHRTVSPYMFFGNVVSITREGTVKESLIKSGAQIAQSDFLSDCINSTQEYSCISRRIYASRQKICKQDACRTAGVI